MTKPNIIQDLMKKLNISKIGVYKRIEKTKKDLKITNTEVAKYCLAFENNINLSRYNVDEKILERVETALRSNFTASPQPTLKKKPNGNEYVQNHKISKTIEKIIIVGKKFGIENIDQNWIDSITILNFIETASTKFLMDHDYSEEDVKSMKWEEKLTKLQNKIYEEAKSKGVQVRSSIGTFFKNYRQVRNDQDHIAHLPTSHVTKDELGLLQKNLDIFINTVFVEHKGYCSK